MAVPSLQLISALRETAERLHSGVYYAWGHHGGCNCGNLLQVVTGLSKEEILTHAHSVQGEWTEIAEEYCSTTNAPAYLLISKLEELGLTPTDIRQLEYLTNREVLDRLPGGFRWLKRNVRQDAVVYFETYANLLEERLLDSMSIDVEALLQPVEPISLQLV